MAAEFFTELTLLDPAETAIGGKARGLALLAAVGLPVPRGIIARPDADFEALALAARALRAPLIVRSSASVEDGAQAGAPGIFESVRDIDHGAVVQAAQTVRSSASSAVARAYAAARRLPEPIAMAVIVQEQVASQCAGTLFTRAPGKLGRNEVWIESQRPPRIARTKRESSVQVRDPDFPLDRAALAELHALALRAERALDAEASGVDVEWVWTGKQFWLVQARPIVPGAAPSAPAPAGWFSALVPGRWRLDASHNPGALSAAQESLVEHVDREGLADTAMRVVQGHLYYREAEPQPDCGHSAAPEQLERFFDGHARPAIEALLVAAEPDVALSIDAALAVHDRVYRIYARSLAPRVSSARRVLADALRAAQPAAGAAAYLARAAAGELDRSALLDAIGCSAQEWDLACPTFAEDPTALDRQLAFAREAATRTRAQSTITRESGEHPWRALAAAVHRVGEEDDLLYARAQWLVRRALLHRARKLGLRDPSVIFRVSLDDARALDAASIELAARPQETARWTMPLLVVDGVAQRAPTPRGTSLRGYGTGPLVRGPAFRVSGHRTVAPAGAVAVAETLTPAGALAVRRAAAIVCEHGGLLGHAAATARELGITCVVGCAGIWHAAGDGDRLAVDGDAGLVIIERDAAKPPQAS